MNCFMCKKTSQLKNRVKFDDDQSRKYALKYDYEGGPVSKAVEEGKQSLPSRRAKTVQAILVQS